MICPSCKAKIAETVRRCPYCGNVINFTGPSLMGKASLMIAVVGIISVVCIFALLFSVGYTAFVFVSIFSILSFILSIVAIVLGAIAFFGKTKDKYGLIGFILGICLFVAAPIATAAMTYVHVSEMMPITPIEYMPTPSIHFVKNDFDDTLTVVSTGGYSAEVYWSDIAIFGTYDTKPSHTFVVPGDQITGCSGTITITYMPTSTSLGTWTFT